jgi:hypothetical protein
VRKYATSPGLARWAPFRRLLRRLLIECVNGYPLRTVLRAQVGQSPTFYESPLRVKCFSCDFWAAVVIPIFYPSVTGSHANCASQVRLAQAGRFESVTTAPSTNEHLPVNRGSPRSGRARRHYFRDNGNLSFAKNHFTS